MARKDDPRTLHRRHMMVPLTEVVPLERFYLLKSIPAHYYIIVIEDTASSNIAAAGSIVVEHKFVHKNGLAGHIEDIVVNERYRGKNFGKWIIEQLKVIGERVGCYKIILDCSDKNVPFYEKCGFTKKEVEMVWYIPQNDGASSPSKL